MKRILTMLCAVAMVMAAAIPAWAAETPGSHYYPIEVSEYMEGGSYRIKKVYQLGLSDDPTGIPTEDFERDGRTYSLLDMTRKDEVGVDTKLYTQTVTLPSDTDDMEQVLQQLDAAIEAEDAEGYAGTLHLDHTTVKVTVDGYATKTRNFSATRTYPNLSDADVSLVPKTIQDGGKTLTLADVKWADSYQTEYDDVVTRWSATATYTGSSTSRYATGYTVTADYTGEIAKTGCDVVTFTAVFGSSAPQEPEQIQESEDPTTREPTGTETPDVAQPIQSADLVRIAVIAGVVLLLAAGGVFVFKKLKERK